MLKNKLIIVIVLLLLMTGCTLVNTSSRTPHEWVTLANSGLSGRDNYSYSAQVKTGINDNIQMSANNFTGQVKSHQEYSINSSEVDSTLLHPAKYMDVINNSDNTVTYVNEPIDANAEKLTLTFRIEEQAETATSRWKSLLEHQFNQIKLSTEQMEIKQIKSDEIVKYIAQSESELEKILSTLSVNSTFKLSVDPVDSIPLSIHEYAILKYQRDGKPFSEYRTTQIHFKYE